MALQQFRMYAKHSLALYQGIMTKVYVLNFFAVYAQTDKLKDTVSNMTMNNIEVIRVRDESRIIMETEVENRSERFR